MLSRVLGFCLGLGVLVMMTGSCGSYSKPTTTPAGNGSLFTLIGDTPSCDLLGYQVEISSLQLRPQGSTSTSLVPVFSTSSGTFIAPRFDIGTLRDFTTILNLASVKEGTYDQATVNLTVTSSAIFNSTQTPPVSNFPVTQTASSIVVSIQPALVVTKSAVSVLKLDYDVARSLQADAQGQLTGSVTPVFRAMPLTATGATGYDDMDDMVGFVRSVTTTSTGTGFTGGFLLQTLAGTGPALTVNLTSSTQLMGVQALNQLLTASLVEVDGYLDSKGNLVANSIRVEDQEAIDQNKVAYLGPVLSVSRDSSGNLTGFSMEVRETEPDDSTRVVTNAGAVVTVSPTTSYLTSFPSADFASLSFDPTALAPGQEVVVHGTFTQTTGQPTSIAADSVYLRLQSVEGNFSSLVTAGSDDKTGAFRFVPCGNVFQNVPTMVITNNQTAFVNLSGLSALTPLGSLLVKGMASFEAQATSINGVQVPSGTLVILAKQVHKL